MYVCDVQSYQLAPETWCLEDVVFHFMIAFFQGAMLNSGNVDITGYLIL